MFQFIYVLVLFFSHPHGIQCHLNPPFVCSSSVWSSFNLSILTDIPLFPPKLLILRLLPSSEDKHSSVRNKSFTRGRLPYPQTAEQSFVRTVSITVIVHCKTETFYTSWKCNVMLCAASFCFSIQPLKRSSLEFQNLKSDCFSERGNWFVLVDLSWAMHLINWPFQTNVHTFITSSIILFSDVIWHFSLHWLLTRPGTPCS